MTAFLSLVGYGISTLGHYTRIKSVQVELGDYASVF